MEVHDDDVAEVLDAAVAQHLGTLADDTRPGPTSSIKFLPFARKYERTHLEESELGFLGRAGDSRTANSISTGRPSASCPITRELIEDRSQRENTVFQDGRETDDARSGAAESVVDGVVVGRICGAELVQGSILFCGIEREACFAEIGESVRGSS